MSLQQLCGRLTRLEGQRRPWVAADILRRARQCAPSELGAFLLAELTGRDRATVDAVMDQLTVAELEALIGPERCAFMDMLSNAEREALCNGGVGAQQRFERAFQRWRSGRNPPMSP